MLNLPSPFIFIRTKSKFSYFEKITLATLALAFLALFIWLAQWEMLDMNKTKTAFSRVGYGNWIAPVLFMMLALVQLAMQRIYRSARLILDQDGLRLEQTSTSALAHMFFFGRKILWSELGKVSYLPGFGVLQLRSKKTLPVWALSVKDWKIQNSAENLSSQLNTNSEPDLIRIFREKGILDAFPKDERLAAVEFDLMAHPVTRKILCGMAVLLTYSVVDAFSQTESWALFNLAYCLPHLITGIIVTIASVFFLSFATMARPLPPAIIGALALLGGLLTGVTSYVGGVRINQAIGGPMLDAPYTRNAACDTLIPDNDKLPEIEYTDLAKSYWCSKDATDTIRVKVRKGLFGLYQVNLKEHTEAIRAFRETH